ncbi:alpha/beta fold hydrolase [Tropicibacter oceani]|uniref:Alpha/beta hydrolase n=1 Tax=Tropicibacter oceani TaxID=3058420 RepID=A0ABY8QE70_9RHOB|nr:alpha/beta hydrolase [Tropicibacter oceani]WGW02303.1 alpha/beta hydrolase [Tropicibacter oceani]
MLTTAPFHADLAEGPALSRAYWIAAADGMRLRIAHYPASEGAQGTVLLFPGRTEYVEKYGRTAAHLAAAGYHTITVDWRGQGLADRMLDDPRTGHVHVFEDYQRDVSAMLHAVALLDLPQPMHLIGHSMGGCIGLRAVMDGLPVASCTFTGPMWGIRIADPLRPAAWALSWGSKHFGLSHHYAPGTGNDSYVASAPFEDNMLTTDPEMWDYMRRQILAQPDLQLGGPSLGWLHEALSETRSLARRPSPTLPCLCFTGTNERIVDIPRIEQRMAHWPGGKLVMVHKGEHELLMEHDTMRQDVMDQILGLFEHSASRRAKTA